MIFTRTHNLASAKTVLSPATMLITTTVVTPLGDGGLVVMSLFFLLRAAKEQKANKA